MMPRILFWLVTVVTVEVNAGATAEEPLVCFGNEPSWALDLTAPDRATLSTPDNDPVVYVGTTSPTSPRDESVWRGRQEDTGLVLVAFLRVGQCSDTMSDTVHRFISSVSTPEGRHLQGCCRTARTSSSAAMLGTTWLLEAEWAPAGAVAVRFEDGRMQGVAGCNTFSGAYELSMDNSVLRPGRIAATLMACPDNAMAVEQRFLRALSGEMAITLSDEQLMLMPVATGERLQFIPATAVHAAAP